MSPALRMLTAVVSCAMAAWFKRYRFNRGEPALWFFAMLTTFALSMALSAVSWWVGDEAISKSFWIAYWIALSGSAFLVFCFARSFGPKADIGLLFWSIPLMFDVALIVVAERHIFERSGGTWVPVLASSAYIVHWSINAAYAVLSVYFCFIAYLALKSHGQREELVHFRFVLYGLVIIFISQLAAGLLRASLSPWNPIAELGTLAGAVLLLVGVVEPRRKIKKRLRQGEH